MAGRLVRRPHLMRAPAEIPAMTDAIENAPAAEWREISPHARPPERWNHRGTETQSRESRISLRSNTDRTQIESQREQRESQLERIENYHDDRYVPFLSICVSSVFDLWLTTLDCLLCVLGASVVTDSFQSGCDGFEGVRDGAAQFVGQRRRGERQLAF